MENLKAETSVPDEFEDPFDCLMQLPGGFYRLHDSEQTPDQLPDILLVLDGADVGMPFCVGFRTEEKLFETTPVFLHKRREVELVASSGEDFLPCLERHFPLDWPRKVYEAFVGMGVEPKPIMLLRVLVAMRDRPDLDMTDLARRSWQLHQDLLATDNLN